MSADDPKHAEEYAELANIVEAALFASDEPLTLRRLMAIFPQNAQPEREQLTRALATLSARYEDHAIELRRAGNTYRFQTRDSYAPWLRKLHQRRPPRYSRALLETLAIVAYRQPVTRGDIEEIRGVSVSSETMRTLLERGWVKQVGNRDVPGRPALFATTPGFLQYFNLESLRDLPPLVEKREPAEIARELNLQLPLAGDAGDSDETSEMEPAHTAEIIPLDPAAPSDADGHRETP